MHACMHAYEYRHFWKGINSLINIIHINFITTKIVTKVTHKRTIRKTLTHCRTTLSWCAPWYSFRRLDNLWNLLYPLNLVCDSLSLQHNGTMCCKTNVKLIMNMCREIRQYKFQGTTRIRGRDIPFRTVLYGTLLVNLNARLGDFSGPFAFLSFELFDGAGSSSSISSTLHSCKYNYELNYLKNTCRTSLSSNTFNM